MIGEVAPSTIANPRLRQGDLDNIVVMALRKEPERRYGSVALLAEDIRRHLEGRPVIARKDTWGYRTTKLIQRNKVAVVAAALVGLALVGGIVTTSWQARAARAERACAEQRFNHVRKLATATSSNFTTSSRIFPALRPRAPARPARARVSRQPCP